jgi:hypothetical protein
MDAPGEAARTGPRNKVHVFVIAQEVLDLSHVSHDVRWNAFSTIKRCRRKGMHLIIEEMPSQERRSAICSPLRLCVSPLSSVRVKCAPVTQDHHSMTSKKEHKKNIKK